MKHDAELMSVADAAERMGKSPQHVRTLLRTGRLVGWKVGGGWIIPADALDELLAAIEPGAPLHVDRIARPSKNSSMVGLSFFSGALGLDLGLESAGIDVVLASEIDKASRETIVSNRPDMALVGDIRDYTASDIRAISGIGNSEIHLVAGGPPCQAFSTAGKRLGFNDERGNVFLKFIELILELHPRYAIIENVRGLLSAPLVHREHSNRGFGYPPLTPEEEKGGALLHIVKELEKGGYGVSFNLYNAANYGAPQKRERVIMICCRDGSKVPYLEPTHADDKRFELPPWITFKQAMAGLQTKGGHTHVTFPEKRLRYYRLLKGGQNWRNLPEKLQQEAMGASYFAGGGRTGFYRRLAWNEPAPTLVTHPAMPATDLAHPKLDRPLSVEEYRRLQVFPDDWILCGNKLDQYRQLGNAVPVPLGHAVGRAVLKHMQGVAVEPVNGFPYSRYKGTSDIEWAAQMRKRAREADQMKIEFD
jgi:DNA (cytosine-5)-methyltransferase 1